MEPVVLGFVFCYGLYAMGRLFFRFFRPKTAYKKNSYTLTTARGETLVLRQVQEEDISPLVEGLMKTFPFIDVEKGRRTLMKILSENEVDRSCFVVCRQQKRVGAISILYEKGSPPFLEMVGLVEGVQRQGIGRALLGWFHDEAPFEVNHICLICSEGNVDALKFYKHLGYKEIGPFDNQSIPPYQDTLFRKRGFSHSPLPFEQRKGDLVLAAPVYFTT